MTAVARNWPLLAVPKWPTLTTIAQLALTACWP